MGKIHKREAKKNKGVKSKNDKSVTDRMGTTYQFNDNRSESVAQLKLQEMVNGYVTKQPIQLKHNEVIQRNEGLASEATIAEAAKSIAPHKDVQQPLVTWITHDYLDVLKIAYTSLASHNIPAPEYEWKSMHGPAAAFNFRTWKIEFNSNLQNQNWTKEDLVTLLYHESRHAEQFFRMIKNKLRSGMEPVEVAQFFNMDKALVDKVIIPASKQLPPPQESKSAAAETKPELDEKAKIWEESVMGSGAEKRALLLYRWQRLEYLKSRITELELFRNSVHHAIDESISKVTATKPPDETERYCIGFIKATSTYLKEMAAWIEASLDKILREKHPDFGNEPIIKEPYNKSTMQQFMEKHLGYLGYSKLNGELQSLRMEFAIGERTQLLTTKSTDETLQADIDAYYKLPEEKDAYDTQGKLTAELHKT